MDLSEEISSAELLQAHTLIWNASLGHIKAMALKCAIELRIPEIIHNHGKSITLSKLIDALSIHPSKAHCVPRLMRFLVQLGFFGTNKHNQQNEEQFYLNVASSLLLGEGLFTSMKPIVAFQLFPELVSGWHSWSNWFHNSDDTLVETTEGSTFYDLLARNQNLSHIFYEAMANDSKLIVDMALKNCKRVFEGLKSLVDIGGGTGAMAKAITNNFPHINCTVFDLPHVVANIQGTENVNFAEGDMFYDPIPPADAILLKWILHNWNEEECLAILKKCREAVLRNGKEGKVIIIEMVIISPNTNHKELYEVQLSHDMVMMAISGKERTLIEWDKLFKTAGFSHYKITPILGVRSIIEVYP